jgi:hypothetical protein
MWLAWRKMIKGKPTDFSGEGCKVFHKKIAKFILLHQWAFSPFCSKNSFFGLAKVTEMAKSAQRKTETWDLSGERLQGFPYKICPNSNHWANSFCFINGFSVHYARKTAFSIRQMVGGAQRKAETHFKWRKAARFSIQYLPKFKPLLILLNKWDSPFQS